MVAQFVASSTSEKLTVWYVDSNTASLDWEVYTVHWQTANTTLYRPVTISIPVDMASVSVVPVASNIMCILSMASLGHAFGTD